MPTINPYIHFNGNAEEAFHFYKSVFGVEFSALARFKDLQNPEQPFPEEEANKIMHIALPIGADQVLMASDIPSFMGTVNEQENRSKIFVATDSKEEADRIYQGLSTGGRAEMPIGNSPWGTYFGMFRDKYGIEWMVQFDANSKA
jgi:PhnB protein